MRSTGRFRFNSHPKLDGTHAILSPSSYHWLNYDEEKLIARLRTVEAAALGTRKHEWAAEAILLGRRQPEDHDILSAYINDALDLGMIPEQMLFYSINCYGTADTIGFEPYVADHEFDGFLRIHDYKSGVAPTSEKQLYVYAGLFCHEYGYKPFRIEGELRIYQGEEVRCFEIDRLFLAQVYDKISSSDGTIEQHRVGGLL